MTDKKQIVIFGGTSEGRELAEYAAGKGIPVLVSVASEYGKHVMSESECLRVRCGRLEEAQMIQLLRQEQPVLVIDATHPHAVEVTRQLCSACSAENVRYLRVVREPAGDNLTAAVDAEAGRRAETEAERGAEASGGIKAGRRVAADADGWRIPDAAGIYWVDTIYQAVELLGLNQEPVLLTTGSKELPLFAGEPSLRERIYARVLPDSRVIASCEQLGIAGKQLIAMQGPFSAEMNRALIHQTKAGWLVTKESGGRGGFEEKLAVIRECGIRGIVIRRPRREEGISPEAVKQLLDEQLIEETNDEKSVTLSLIGMGMGMGKQLTAEAMEALKACDAVLGAPRMLADLAAWTNGRQTAPAYLGRDVYGWILAHPECRRIAVIYSGDTGFHSGSRSLCEWIRSEKEAGNPKAARIEVKIYPGISTAVCLCARLQTTWEDLYFASAHGRECDAAKLLKKRRRVFLLLGSEHALGDICMELTKEGMGDVLVKAGERLGYDNERILDGCARELCSIQTDPLTAVILERKEMGLDEG